jgi:hypothetical protein
MASITSFADRPFSAAASRFPPGREIRPRSVGESAPKSTPAVLVVPPKRFAALPEPPYPDLM